MDDMDLTHRPTRGRDGSDGTYAVGCSCGAATCDWDGWLLHRAELTTTIPVRGAETEEGT